MGRWGSCNAKPSEEERYLILLRIYIFIILGQGSYFTNLKNLPPPVLICGVACDIVQIPQAFDCLWSQQIVRIIWLKNVYLYSFY